MEKEQLQELIENNKEDIFSEIKDEISDDTVTDIEWDGYNLWITQLGRGCYISMKELSDKYMDNLSIRLANIMGASFNRMHPILEANTESLRISIWHESRCGRKSMAIRKIPRKLRFGHGDLVKSDYAPESIITLLENCADTVNVMLEAATFNGPSIRRTSKALGLRSEASGRFERGVDTVLTHNALNRAAHLLEQMGACETVCGIVEAYPTEAQPAVVKVNTSAINTRIGVEIETGEMISILQKLQFEVHEEGEDLVVTAPSWRYDVTCDADISEEIARMHSYDKIASHMPALPLVQGRQDVIEDVRDSVEDYLASVGLSEVMTYSFIHPCSFDKLELPADDERRRFIEVMNPISDEFKVMRTTLVPSILSTVAYNLARQSESVKIFEVGRTYLPKALPLTEFPVEKRVLCAAMSGKRNVLNWTEGKDNVDFYDMKGVVEGLLSKLQVTDYKLILATQPYLHPGKSCAIEYQGELIGYFGEVHPTVAANFELSSETYVLELAIEPLVAAAVKVPKYKHLPKFPGTSRDIAVVVPLEVSMRELEGVIRANAGELLTDAKVFDVYTGKQVADGCKSMAFNLTFQAGDRTLTDTEIDTVIKNVVDKVGEEYKAKLRA